MPHFDWTINFGIILHLATLMAGLVIAYMKLANRIDAFRIELEGVNKILIRLHNRMDTHENRLLDLAKDTQRLIGAYEAGRPKET